MIVLTLIAIAIKAKGRKTFVCTWQYPASSPSMIGTEKTAPQCFTLSMTAVTFWLIPYRNEVRDGRSSICLFVKLHDFLCLDYLFCSWLIGPFVSKDFVAFQIKDPYFLHSFMGSVNI